MPNIKIKLSGWVVSLAQVALTAIYITVSSMIVNQVTTLIGQRQGPPSPELLEILVLLLITCSLFVCGSLLFAPALFLLHNNNRSGAVRNLIGTGIFLIVLVALFVLYLLYGIPFVKPA